jgi:hypothetical protein
MSHLRKNGEKIERRGFGKRGRWTGTAARQPT